MPPKRSAAGLTAGGAKRAKTWGGTIQSWVDDPFGFGDALGATEDISFSERRPSFHQPTAPPAAFEPPLGIEGDVSMAEADLFGDFEVFQPTPVERAVAAVDQAGASAIRGVADFVEDAAVGVQAAAEIAGNMGQVASAVADAARRRLGPELGAAFDQFVAVENMSLSKALGTLGTLKALELSGAKGAGLVSNAAQRALAERMFGGAGQLNIVLTGLTGIMNDFAQHETARGVIHASQIGLTMAGYKYLVNGTGRSLGTRGHLAANIWENAQTKKAAIETLRIANTSGSEIGRIFEIGVGEDASLLGRAARGVASRAGGAIEAVDDASSRLLSGLNDLTDGKAAASLRRSNDVMAGRAAAVLNGVMQATNEIMDEENPTFLRGVAHLGTDIGAALAGNELGAAAVTAGATAIEATGATAIAETVGSFAGPVGMILGGVVGGFLGPALFDWISGDAAARNKVRTDFVNSVPQHTDAIRAQITKWRDELIGMKKTLEGADMSQLKMVTGIPGVNNEDNDFKARVDQYIKDAEKHLADEAKDQKVVHLAGGTGGVADRIREAESLIQMGTVQTEAQVWRDRFNDMQDKMNGVLNYLDVGQRRAKVNAEAAKSAGVPVVNNVPIWENEAQQSAALAAFQKRTGWTDPATFIDVKDMSFEDRTSLVAHTYNGFEVKDKETFHIDNPEHPKHAPGRDAPPQSSVEPQPSPAPEPEQPLPESGEPEPPTTSPDPAEPAQPPAEPAGGSASQTGGAPVDPAAAASAAGTPAALPPVAPQSTEVPEESTPPPEGEAGGAGGGQPKDQAQTLQEGLTPAEIQQAKNGSWRYPPPSQSSDSGPLPLMSLSARARG